MKTHEIIITALVLALLAFAGYLYWLFVPIMPGGGQ
jgi:hypothetical protein